MFAVLLYTLSTYIPTFVKAMLYVERAETVWTFGKYVSSMWRRRLTPAQQEEDMMSGWIELRPRGLSRAAL